MKDSIGTVCMEVCRGRVTHACVRACVYICPLFRGSNLQFYLWVLYVNGFKYDWFFFDGHHCFSSNLFLLLFIRRLNLSYEPK